LYVEQLRANPTEGAFVVGEGKNIKSLTHILDVVDVYIHLVSEALQPGGGRADWGVDGFYFTATSTISFPEFAEKVVALSKRKAWLSETTPDEVRHISAEQAKNLFQGWGAYMWGSNSVSRADRAEKVFGWKGKAPSWQDCLEEDLEIAFAKDDRSNLMKARVD